MAIFADLNQPLGVDLMVDVTGAPWEAEGSRTAPGKDVIKRFAYAAVKAAEEGRGSLPGPTGWRGRVTHGGLVPTTPGPA